MELQPLHLGRQQPPVLLAPGVERRLADPCLAAHLRDRRSFLRLPQHKRDLLLAEPRLLHPNLRPARTAKLEFSSSPRSSFPGACHSIDQPVLQLCALLMLADLTGS